MTEMVPYRLEHQAGFRRLVVDSLAEFGFREDALIDRDLTSPAECYDALWIVLDGGRVAGSAALRVVAGGVGELKRMYLSPDLRGKGHGRALLDRVLDWAREHGLAAVELDTAESMHAAQRFYERAGFVRTGERIESGERERRREILYRLDLGRETGAEQG